MEILKQIQKIKRKHKPLDNFSSNIKEKNKRGTVLRDNWNIIRRDCFAGVFKLKYGKIVVMAVMLAVIFEFVGFSAPVLAEEAVLFSQQKFTAENGAVLDENEVELINKKLAFIENLPQNRELLFIDLGVRTITAYSSTVEQCDSSPCITANGFNVCEHGLEDTIAANFLKFGTKVRIPEVFGDRIFIVRDRMNQRYSDRVDVWMIKTADARRFGVKNTRIEVVVE